jgi:hypothetical protein
MKTTQNVIRNRLRTMNLVDDGHTFQLNVKQLYKPTSGKEKYQIRKPHYLHIHNLKALIKYNPYAHVVDYLVLVDLMEGHEIKNLPNDMTITPWRIIQGVKDEKIIIVILSCVRSGELSMEEKCDEFKK